MQSPSDGFVIPTEGPFESVSAQSRRDGVEGVGSSWHARKGVWVPDSVVARMVRTPISPESHYRVYLLLVLRACRYGTSVAMIKSKDIATSTGCAARTVYRALSTLQHQGVITRMAPGRYDLVEVIDER